MPNPGSPRRILVIEDEPAMRRNLLTMLQLEGFLPLGADNGRDGIALARRERPDLILCDVMMPELDGFGVLTAVRGDPAIANTPFIFLSARGERLDVRTGMNLGADDYLVKPVGCAELLAAIEARFERHESFLARAQAEGAGFHPDFSSPAPLESFGLTPREAEVLLWVAQGKSNGDIAVILAMAEKTVKKHLTAVFEKLGVDGRHAATLRALETLSGGATP
jgi:DNA-binding NarL/FixJ family response regulator